MSHLVAIAYDDLDTAQQVVANIGQAQAAHEIELEDLVIVERRGDGKIKLHQPSLAGAGAAGGALWGGLIGLIFLMPLFGMAIGAASGRGRGRARRRRRRRQVHEGARRAADAGQRGRHRARPPVTMDKVLDEHQDPGPRSSRRRSTTRRRRGSPRRWRRPGDDRGRRGPRGVRARAAAPARRDRHPDAHAAAGVHLRPRWSRWRSCRSAPCSRSSSPPCSRSGSTRWWARSCSAAGIAAGRPSSCLRGAVRRRLRARALLRRAGVGRDRRVLPGSCPPTGTS